MLLPPCLPYALSYFTELSDQESMSSRWSATAIMVQASLKAFDDVILEASCCTLKPKQIPDPKGARWWEQCM
jgi:hypothetical protein